MLAALATDFSALDGVAVDVMRDARYRDFQLPACAIHEVANDDEEGLLLSQLAAAADWTLIVAPEFDGHLHARCQWVEQAGGRLLGPNSRLVALASDKQHVAEHLTACGVPVPAGMVLAPFAPLPADFDYPAILKPRDGAGSLGIERIDSPEQNRRNGAAAARLERFCPGRAASVAVLCGPRAIIPLQPCWQLLKDDRTFAYTGGAIPIPSACARRAIELAMRAIHSLDNPLGYLGVDLVLGDDSGGAHDVVIEINPRITTSYVGLRALCQQNLAACMLAIAGGHESELSWRAGSIQFGASGEIRRGFREGGES
jgi:predicted ATP-grasp superfamily ATP-dependent carboligase